MIIDEIHKAQENPVLNYNKELIGKITITNNLRIIWMNEKKRDDLYKYLFDDKNGLPEDYHFLSYFDCPIFIHENSEIIISSYN